MPERVINATPHKIVLYDAAGHVLRVFLPSGYVVRRVRTVEPVGTFMGVPVNRVVYGRLSPLPPLEPGDVLLVSSLALEAAAAAVPEGVRVLAPDAGATAVRGPDGRIHGVRAFLAPSYSGVTEGRK